MSGKDFYLKDDKKILGINSPKANVSGPYAVVFKDDAERYAIVALDWNSEPRLGMRWFYGNGGNPFSSVHPTWFIIPPFMTKSILSGLPILHIFSTKIDDYLSGNISGKDLKDYKSKVRIKK